MVIRTRRFSQRSLDGPAEAVDPSILRPARGEAVIATPGQTVLRAATAADLPALVTMGCRFLAETSYAGRVAENPDQMAELAAQLIAGEASTILVLDRDGALVGMIGMLVYAHHISAERVAGEVFWWVNPADRGSAGIRLLKAAEQWGRDRGAASVQMMAPSPRVAALYARLGYAAVETTYQKDLTVWRSPQARP